MMEVGTRIGVGPENKPSVSMRERRHLMPKELFGQSQHWSKIFQMAFRRHCEVVILYFIKSTNRSFPCCNGIQSLDHFV